MEICNKKIIGEKIVLRPITFDDTNLIVKWRNNPHVKEKFIFQEIFTAEIHENWMKTKIMTGEVCQYIIEEKSNDKPIGSVYFRDIDYVKGIAEYGIFIGEDEERGKGYGTMAAKLAIDYAIHQLKLKKIFLRVFTDNKIAIKSYESVGFKYDRTETIILENKEERKIDFMILEKGN